MALTVSVPSPLDDHPRIAAAEVKQIVLWYRTHLLSVAVCLLFAYGVAWLHDWLHRTGIWQGTFSSGLLWAVVLLATLPLTIGIPRDLLLIEGGSTAVATIVVGAIIGALSGRLVLPTLEARQPIDHQLRRAARFGRPCE